PRAFGDARRRRRRLDLRGESGVARSALHPSMIGRSSMAVRRKAAPAGQAVLGMSAARFLATYWQKKPLVVRGAFPSFRDSLSPDELAGLACEEGVESRLVREEGGAEPWEVVFGPHEPAVFETMPDRGWTLLVQDVNRHVP